MDVRVLGPLEVATGGRTLQLQAPKPRALLALLVLHARETVSADRLTEELWQGDPPPAALHTLQVYASQLRGALRELGDEAAGLLVTRRPGYVLELAPEQLDVARFEQLAREGRAALAGGDAARAAGVLGAALDEWRGDAYAEFAYERWAEVEIQRLGELRAATIEARIDAELALGHHGALLAELAGLVERYPLREGLRARQMLALYRAGRQADALAVYRDARATLDDELGIAPGGELQALERSILQQDPALGAPSQPNDTARVPTRVRLPVPSTQLIGRARDVALIGDLLSGGVRLLTLTGAGGIGKTRLALASAAALADRYPGGVSFAGLGPIADPALVLPTIARSLEVEEDASVMEALARRLETQPALVVVDNVEHVLDAARDLADLLSCAPALTVLATSRAPLRLSWERVYRVGALAVPDADAPDLETLLQADALRLFLDRIRAVRADLVPDEESTRALAEICVRLDGLPLALELAAARSRHLSPNALLSRLEQRLTLLDDGPRDAPDRHRSLRATLGWSVALLDAGERVAFARSAVFATSFDLEAAAAVIDPQGAEAALLDSLGRLVDASLLEPVPGASSEPRFALLATVREYALELLQRDGTTDEARGCLAAWALSLAERSAPELVRAGQAAWLDRLERELDNLRAALRWLESRDDHEGLCRLAASLRRFWLARGRATEGLGWLEAGLAGRLSDDVRTEALLVAGLLASKSQPARARALLEEAEAIAAAAGDVPRRAQALTWLGFLARGRGELATGAALGEQAVSHARAVGDERLIAITLTDLASTLHELGEQNRSRALFAEAAELFATIGDRHNYAVTLGNLGEYAVLDGALTDARSALERSQAVAEELGDEDLAAISRGYLGLVELCEGAPERAEELARAALTAVYRQGDVGEVVAFVRVLAGALAASGERPLAARLWGATEAARAAQGLAPDSSPLPAHLAPCGRSGEEPAIAEAQAAGRSLTLDEAVALALAERA
jgi:predicted ATPase/DNA-binding SARP family transcriptional activator